MERMDEPMKKFEKDYHIHTDNCRIKRELDPILKSAEIPETLRPENLETLIAGKEKRPLPGARRPYLRLTAAFASLCLVVAATAAVLLQEKPSPNDIPPVHTLKIDQPEDYTDVWKSISAFRPNKGDVIYDGIASGAQDTAVPETTPSTKPGATGGNSGSLTDGTEESPSENEHSETNEQVAGVRESDIIKTDGNYIYSLKTSGDGSSSPDNCIFIHEIRPDGSLKQVGKIENKTYPPKEIYVDGDTLTVLSDGRVISKQMYGNLPDSEEYMARETTAAVYIYDISDRSKPTLINSYTQQGDVLSSRMIDGYLYLMTNYYISDGMVKDEPATYIPQITYPSRGSAECISADNIYLPEKPQDLSYIVVTAVNTREKQAAVTQKAVLGAGNTVYCSEENLYILGSQYLWNDDSQTSTSRTQIMRFALDKAEVTYSGNASVKGTSLNQFSADEHNGIFRIATHDTESINRVYLLDKELKQVGVVDHIADGEQIKSVRFQGDTGYVVTFFQTDPLFVLDLKDPKHPKITGELKIPGFSSYLHPLGDNLMIGIGADTDENGVRCGFKMSLFDVSDPKAPRELNKYTIADHYYGTNALTEITHKALFVDAEKGLVGLPLLAQNTTQQINHFVLFEVSREKGIVLKTAIGADGKLNSFDHAISQSAGWFAFQRGLFAGNYLYLYTGNELLSFDYNTYQKIGSYPLS